MAIVIAFRIAIALTPVVTRWAASGGSPPTQGLTLWLQEKWADFINPAKSTDELNADLATYLSEGEVAGVTDTSAPFETRKLSVRFARSPAGLVAEDVDVIGVQFLKSPGGVPTNAWVDADYTTIESAFDTLWTALKPKHASDYQLNQYRWYADGPAFHPAPELGNPARRVTDRAVAGSAAAGTTMMPPQDACTVTFITAHRRSWGRIYWPAMTVTQLHSTGGILENTTCDDIRAAWVTFLNACRAASLIPVVFSLKHSLAISIDSIRVDNLVDVQRRRRWKGASYKTTVALT